MARRGENIYRRKDGRWEARYKKLQNQGRVNYGYVYGKTYGDVKQKKLKALADMEKTMQGNNLNAHPELTLRKLAGEWLDFKSPSVKESTYVRYRNLYERHIDYEFGDEKLKNLDIESVEKYIIDKQDSAKAKGLAPKTIQDIIAVFRMIMAFAADKAYIPPINIKKAKQHVHLCADTNKATILLNNERIIFEQYVLNNHDVRSFGIYLTLYTGLRIGELCALRWEDIDFKNGILYVNHTIQRLHDYSYTSDKKTKIIIGTPKTESSARMIPLAKFLVNKLISYESLPNHYVLTDSLFPEEPRSYLYFYRKQLRDCGLPSYNFHTLRHTFATRCVEEGIDIKALSEILGHSNVKITMNRYVHPSIESKRQYLEKLYAVV